MAGPRAATEVPQMDAARRAASGSGIHAGIPGRLAEERWTLGVILTNTTGGLRGATETSWVAINQED